MSGNFYRIKICVTIVKNTQGLPHIIWKLEKPVYNWFQYPSDSRKGEKMERRFIADKIGEEYKKWKRGDIIFLNAPTGSGKTRFILSALLPFAINARIKILYFVNRRILKSQLETIILNETSTEIYAQHGYWGSNILDVITVRTYQELENRLKGKNPERILDSMKNYGIVVCDECHYFYADSNFNTSTELSFDCIRKIFDDKIQIYMSATIENVETMIKGREPIFFFFVGDSRNYVVQINPCRYKKYEIEADYSYVNMTYLENKDDLIQLICENKESRDKWLIFVDSISFGEKLKKSLCNEKNNSNFLNETSVVFIDAKYKKDDSARASVLELDKKKLIEKTVIIATSVIDNGISFEDVDLRKIVILADSKEEFIQMLGRKRADGKVVQVYIEKCNKEYFRQRLQKMEYILEFFNREFASINQSYGVLFQDVYGRTTSSKSIYPYNVIEKNIDLRPIFQQKALEHILSDETLYNYARQFLYVVRGTFAVNSFSIHRLNMMKTFYHNMLAKIQDNSEAFVQEQAKWLGKSEEEIGRCIIESVKDTKRRYAEVIEKEILKILNISLNREGNIELKKKILEPMRYFYGSQKEEQKKKDFVKKDRPFQPQEFNLCMKNAALGYVMRSEKRGYFVIEKEDFGTPK